MRKRSCGLWALIGAVVRLPRAREVILRAEGRITYIPLSRLTQLALIFLLAGFGAWVGHTTYQYFDLQRVIVGKDSEIARAAQKNRELFAKMGRMRSEFSDVAGTLERNHRDLVNLLGQNDALKKDLDSVAQKLFTSEKTRTAGDRRRVLLSGKLSRLERKLQEVEQRNDLLAGNLTSTKSALTSALAARSSVERVRRALSSRVEKLDRRLARLRQAQKSLLNRVMAKAVGDIRKVERMITEAGLDAERLLRRANGRPRGQGGPFVPFGMSRRASDPFEDGVAVFDRHLGRLGDLQKLVRKLPLIAPLDDYRINSGFGRRRDPFNKRWARHDGLDMSAKMRTPVMSTAPGKVVFAGWKGRFGRMVMIDHGLGIRTRYGHLRRIFVKKGRRVKFRQTIGQAGSSGRSTGPHLHYEILIDGKPVDPVRFLKAGKNVLEE